MNKKLLTFKMKQQLNGLYELQVYDGACLIKEERNLSYENAVARIEELKGERDATTQGLATERPQAVKC